MTNQRDGTVSVINTASNTVVATVGVGSFPHGVAITPDGTRAYVTNEGSFTVSVIDTASNTVVATVPVERLPNGVAITPDGTRAYVANAGSKTVSVINTASNTVVATVDVESTPNGVAITPDGTRAYVTNYGQFTVSVINRASNTVVATVGVGDFPVAVAITGECSMADDVDGNGNPDNDGDGLCDSWEMFGVDGDGDGIPDLDLAALGADPNHKDLFIEVDYMAGLRPDENALIMVDNAFRLAPVTSVTNPDGIRGIRVHFVGSQGRVDEEIPFSAKFNFPEYIDANCSATSFNDLKRDHFGTPAERSPSQEAKLKAKRKVFRYVIFGNQQSDRFRADAIMPCQANRSSGRAELPGNDLIVTLGAVTPGGFRT